MRLESVLVLIVIVGSCQLVRETEGYAAKCKDMDLVHSEQEMMHMKDCLTEVKAETFADITMDKVGCFTKCCMIKMELVDGDGKPHKENMNKSIGALWTDEGLKNAMQEGIGKCLDTDGTHLKKDDDEKCSSYQPLSTCMHAAFMAVCA